MRILIVTAVAKEADAISSSLSTSDGDTVVCVGGVGRTNAAAATTEAIVRAEIEQQPFQLVLSVGIAGALPQEQNQDSLCDTNTRHNYLLRQLLLCFQQVQHTLQTLHLLLTFLYQRFHCSILCGRNSLH